MTPDAFEQLVSQWLDDPSRVDLRAQIDAAIAENPPLGAIFAQWERTEAALRSAARVPTGVDWQRLAAQTAARVNIAVDRPLDDLLRGPTAVDQRVDWQRLKSRIAAAVAMEHQTTIRRQRRRWLIRGSATIAAAAALVLALLPMRHARHEPEASVTVGRPGDTSQSLAFSTIRAPRVSESERTSVVAVTIAAADQRSEPVPERFFVIDPLTAPRTADDVPDYY